VDPTWFHICLQCMLRQASLFLFFGKLSPLFPCKGEWRNNSPAYVLATVFQPLHQWDILNCKVKSVTKAAELSQLVVSALPFAKCLRESHWCQCDHQVSNELIGRIVYDKYDSFARDDHNSVVPEKYSPSALLYYPWYVVALVDIQVKKEYGPKYPVLMSDLVSVPGTYVCIASLFRWHRTTTSISSIRW